MVKYDRIEKTTVDVLINMNWDLIYLQYGGPLWTI